MGDSLIVINLFFSLFVQFDLLCLILTRVFFFFINLLNKTRDVHTLVNTDFYPTQTPADKVPGLVDRVDFPLWNFIIKINCHSNQSIT